MARNDTLYNETLKILKAKIVNNTYTFQSRLPSETAIAKELGVSRNTVRKVLKTLKEEGFIDSHQGSRWVVSGKNISRYIPVIIQKDSKNYRITEIFEGAHDFFDGIGFSSLLTLADNSPEKERDLIRKLINEGHRNFIIYTVHRSNTSFYQNLLRKGYNCVFVDTLPGDITCDYVTSCNFLGGYEATKKLIDLGHRDIAFCSLPDPSQTRTVEARYKGYLSALEQNGIPVSNRIIFIKKDMTFDEFADFVVQNLSATAIFASTDELAVLLMRDFELSSKHPAIVGFDNTILSESYNFASVNQNFYEMGKTAAELLYKRITNPKKNYEHIYVPVSLIERASLTRPEWRPQ